MNLLDTLELDYCLYLAGAHAPDPLTDFVRARLKDSTATDRIMLRTMCSLRDSAEVYDNLMEAKR